MFELGKSLLWVSFVHPTFLALKPYKSLELLRAFSSLWWPLSGHVCGGAHGTSSAGDLCWQRDPGAFVDDHYGCKSRFSSGTVGTGGERGLGIELRSCQHSRDSWRFIAEERSGGRWMEND